MSTQIPSWPATEAPALSLTETPAEGSRAAVGAGLTVFRGLVKLVLVTFAILVLLPALIAAQAAAGL